MKLYRKKWIIIGSILLIILALFMETEHSVSQKEQESKLPMTEQEEMIRVLIKTNGFQNIVHESVSFCAENGLLLNGEEIGTEYTIAPDDPSFSAGSVKLSAMAEGEQIQITSLKRGYGIPSYAGTFELFSTAEGMIIINELPLESYLCKVVPSEMPASYELEALKCQAICARSYAYIQMQEMAYPEYGAHVDDSVSFQVYGNSKEQESTNQAVRETCGQMLWYEGKVAKTYYYSTSSGKTTDVSAWGTTVQQENTYLKSVTVCDEEGVAYEKELPWFRWSATVSAKELENQLELYAGKEIGTLEQLEITKTGAGEIALEVKATGNLGEIVVATENKIRRALGNLTIQKQDGTVASKVELLPSAFFSIEKKEGIYYINGGGYGHGIGMSQNGANEMAKAGWKTEEILSFFYVGTQVA